MNQWDQYEARRVTLVQQDPRQVPQQHVLVRVAGLAAQRHGPPHHGQGLGVEPLQVQDGGQVAHQHQGLTGDSREQASGWPPGAHYLGPLAGQQASGRPPGAPTRTTRGR